VEVPRNRAAEPDEEKAPLESVERFPPTPGEEGCITDCGRTRILSPVSMSSTQIRSPSKGETTEADLPLTSGFKASP